MKPEPLAAELDDDSSSDWVNDQRPNKSRKVTPYAYLCNVQRCTYFSPCRNKGRVVRAVEHSPPHIDDMLDIQQAIADQEYRERAAVPPDAAVSSRSAIFGCIEWNFITLFH